MIYETDLFSFSFVPNWYLQLDALAELALPEPWRFRSGSYSEKNYDTPILERYIQSIFRKQVIDYNAATDMAEKDRIILMRNEYACFHTGLYTKRYKPIYACFGRNKKLDSLLKWCFRGFADENSALLRYISPLPEKPLYSMPLQGIHYVPDWPVRVNVEHILGDPRPMSQDCLPNCKAPAICLSFWKRRLSWRAEKPSSLPATPSRRLISRGCNTSCRCV